MVLQLSEIVFFVIFWLMSAKNLRLLLQFASEYASESSRFALLEKKILTFEVNEFCQVSTKSAFLIFDSSILRELLPIPL